MHYLWVLKLLLAGLIPSYVWGVMMAGQVELLEDESFTVLGDQWLVENYGRHYKLISKQPLSTIKVRANNFIDSFILAETTPEKGDQDICICWNIPDGLDINKQYLNFHLTICGTSADGGLKIIGPPERQGTQQLFNYPLGQTMLVTSMSKRLIECRLNNNAKISNISVWGPPLYSYIIALRKDSHSEKVLGLYSTDVFLLAYNTCDGMSGSVSLMQSHSSHSYLQALHALCAKTPTVSDNMLRGPFQIMPLSSGTSRYASGPSTCKKNKQRRTVFTSRQESTLQNVFNQKQYIDLNERAQLAQETDLLEKTVRIWFQNRRMRQKHIQQNISQMPSN